MLPLPVAKSNQLRSYHDPLPSGHTTISHPARRDLSASSFLLGPSAFESLSSVSLRQAKKRLIATLPKLKIELTDGNKRLNDFLIATKIAIHPVPDFPSEWPRRSERDRMSPRLLLLKFLPGDTSGLQDRACSLFYLAGTK